MASYKLIVNDDFLAHHGVQGMKWGVHNDETKLKYGEIDHLPGGGGGGSEEDDRPEALLKAGKIDEATAAEMRKKLDNLITMSEDGKLNGNGLYERAVNKVYADAGLSQPYSDYKVGSAPASKPSATPLDYNPNTKEGRQHRQSMADWLVDQGVKAAKDTFNKHLDDIQSGNIGREEARVVGIVNAAAAGASGSGKGVISNPKAKEMGVTYGQDADEYKRIK